MSSAKTMRTILQTLKRKTLLAIADGEGIELEQRRALAPIQEGLARKRSLTLEVLLGHMSRDELKAACRALDLDDSGKAKSTIAKRIMESVTSAPRRRGSHQQRSKTSPARRRAKQAGSKSAPPARGSRWRMPQSCDQILRGIRSWEEFRKAASALTKKRKGDLFERLVKFFLELDERYTCQLKRVWLWHEVPPRVLRSLGYRPDDRGSDLLAESLDGGYWVVQAKYRSDTSGAMPYGELGTFGAHAGGVGKRGPAGVVCGLLCATKREPTPDFATARGLRFQHVLMDTWGNLEPEFWGRVRAKAKGKEPPPLKPATWDGRPYQGEAVHAARRHFVMEGHKRGKLIMPCGTGKSLMGYWTAVRALKARTILIAVPSLDLLKQTLKVWAREAAANGRALDPLVVCSDKTTAEGDIHVADLDAPATTDAREIQAWLRGSSTGKTRVIFVTYQSGPVLAKAVGRFEFDVALLDEAHKTAGYTGKNFQHLLYQKHIRIKHRVFMTATERYYDGDRDEITGMNDARVYGETYYTMTFGQAIEDGILADFAVVLLAVTRSEAENYRELIQERWPVVLSGEGLDASEEVGVIEEAAARARAITAEDLAAAVALRKAMKQFGLTHAISFHSRNDYAKDFVRLQEVLNGSRRWRKIETYRVSSAFSAGRRDEELGCFRDAERALISNARCLTEGVDVPAIDLVLFAQPRHSKVDIVQAVGRALRKGARKEKTGYVLAPVLVEDGEQDLEQIVAGTGFENLVTVVKAMATVGEDVGDKVQVLLSHGARKGSWRGGEGNHEGEVVTALGADELAEAILLRCWQRSGLRFWRGFEEARAFVQSLNLEGGTAWREYLAGDRPELPPLPFDIPRSPQVAYKAEWKGYGDFLGTGNVSNRQKSAEFLSYEDARGFVNALGLTSAEEWRKYSRGELKGLGEKPPEIPAAPYKTYERSGWTNWRDWLGSEEVAAHGGFMAFQEARALARSRKLSSTKEFRAWCRGELPDCAPDSMPRTPERVYRDAGWRGYGDFLGTGRLSSKDASFTSYEVARAWSRALGLTSVAEWRERCKAGLPPGIPTTPERAYADQGWRGYPDWLGTATLRPGEARWLNFEDARARVRLLGLRSKREWSLLIADQLAGKSLPPRVPKAPWIVYRDAGWVSVRDWLGYADDWRNRRRSNYLPFEEARVLARHSGISTAREWRFSSAAKELPDAIPVNPDTYYKTEGWAGWPDFLRGE